MKKNTVITFALAAVLAAVSVLPSAAQTKTPKEDYAKRYELLVSKLGPAGVGIETLLSKWGNDYPEDLDMLIGRFTYYLYKGQTTNVEIKDAKKYLGQEPMLSLKDSLQNDVNYFQVVSFDDELFGKAMTAIDKAIELNPDRLDLRFLKISAFIEYEKDSPDMALSHLNSLIDYNCTSKPTWIYPEEEANDELFTSSIQEYCYTFYRLGSTASFEAFRSLSEKMMGYYPDNPMFQTNIGSYYLVCKKDSKAALKIYNKVLKKHPDDYSTIKNCVLLARTEKNVKLEKKYLPMLVRVTTDETERTSAKARLEAL